MRDLVRRRLGGSRIGGAGRPIVLACVGLELVVLVGIVLVMTDAMFSENESIGTVILLGLPLLALYGGAMHMLVRVLSSGVYIDGDEVVVLNPLRSHEFTSSEVSEFVLVEEEGAVYVIPRHSRPVRCFGVDVFWPRRRRVGGLVDELNAVIGLR